MPNDENAARADSDKQDAVIIDAQLLSSRRAFGLRSLSVHSKIMVQRQQTEMVFFADEQATEPPFVGLMWIWEKRDGRCKFRQLKQQYCM